MKKKELYEALYTDLDNGKENELSLEKDDMRNKTLKTLLGVKEAQLSDRIKEYNKIQKAREELGNEDANTTGTGEFNDIVEYWKAIHHLYVCYLKKLKDSLGDNKTINKILIYEAPPMPSDKNNGKINYILAKSCGDCKPLKDGEPCDDCKIDCDLLTNEPKGDYYTTIDELTNDNYKIQDILVNQGILFIDLCPLPLPMTTKIRKSVWGEYFVDEEKPLTVVLLELALRFTLEKGIKISENPIIAMGTPTATSQSIYLYFEQMKSSGCLTKTFTSIDGNLNIDFSKLLEINEKYDKENQILPLYKSNIIAGSNTPNAELLKRIF